MKKRIRLTESDLHRIIKKSVKGILNEGNYEGDYEGARYGKMNNANYNSYDFVSSMEDKIMENFLSIYFYCSLRRSGFTSFKQQHYFNICWLKSNTYFPCCFLFYIVMKLTALLLCN